MSRALCMLSIQPALLRQQLGLLRKSRSYCLGTRQGRESDTELRSLLPLARVPCFFIDFFEKTGPQLVINLVEDADDLLGQFCMFISALICVDLRQIHLS